MCVRRRPRAERRRSPYGRDDQHPAHVVRRDPARAGNPVRSRPEVTVTTTTSSAPRPVAARRIIIGIAACAAFVALGAWAYGLFGGMIDLRVYRMGGSVLLHGGSLYYAELAGSGLPF